MTRAEALQWNRDWDNLDRRRVEAAIEAVPSVATLIMPPSGAYIAAWVYGDLESHENWGPILRRNHRCLIIKSGQLVWPGGRYNRDLDRDLFPRLEEGEGDIFGTWSFYEWFPLSTYRGSRGRPKRQSAEQVLVCGTCHTALPKTGICDFC